MIENKNESSRNLEKALQALEQAKQRVANEKKKQNEKKSKAEVTYSSRLQGAHRYTTRGGMCALRGASFTCNGQCQQAGICGGCCLSCDSQKGKRQSPFASGAYYPLVNFAFRQTLNGNSRTRANSLTDNRTEWNGGRKKFNRNISVIVVFY